MLSNFIKGTAIGTAFATVFATGGFAEEVTLKSLDGAFSLKGELVEFDGENYLIKSVFGQVLIASIDVVCEGDGCPDISIYVKDFSIAGANALADELLPALLQASSLQAGYRPLSSVAGVTEILDIDNETVASVTISSNSTAFGMDAIAVGQSVLAMATRDATASEAVRIGDAGLGDILAPARQSLLATDGLVILVANNNPVKGLSVQQIGEIFSGVITNWSQVGGRDAPISVYRQMDGTDDVEQFQNAIFARSTGEFAANVEVVRNDIAEVVSRNPNGIGFSSFVEMGQARGVAINASCGISTAPNVFTLKSEEYPFTNRLSVLSPDVTLPGFAQELVDFLGSDQAQSVVSEAGFVNLLPIVKPAGSQDARFANAILAASVDTSLADLQAVVSELGDFERLSTTIRFNSNQNALEARTVGDLLRVAEYLGARNTGSLDVLLVGFTDAEGPAEVNANQSRQLAQMVSEQLELPNGIQIKTLGFGEAAPLVCSDAPRADFINTRVEVWIRSAN